jgi:hypothetical protein
MNKKASKWMSPYLFFIFVFVAIFIVIGVVLFYSVKVDVRQEEAQFLTNKLIDCIKNQESIPNEEFDYYTKCKLNEQIINNNNYYIKIETTKEETTKKIFETGVKDYKIRCDLKKEDPDLEGDIPKCQETKIIIKNSEINLFVASNNLGEEL